MSRLSALLSAVCLCAAPLAHAERPVTLGEALEAALAHNPTVGRSALSRDISRAGVQGARSTFDPIYTANVTANRGRSRGFFQGFPYKVSTRDWNIGNHLRATLPTGLSFSIDGTFARELSSYTTDFGGTASTETVQNAYRISTGISVTQPLLRGAWMAYNLQAVTRARDGLTTAELALEQARQEILAGTARAYWTWSYQVDLVQIAHHSADVAREALRVGALRVAAGDLAPVERTRLQAALAQAESQEIDAAIAARQAADAVLLLLGDTPGEDLLPASPPGEPPPLELNADDAVAVAMAQNLDLLLARAQATAAGHEARAARHARLPVLNVTLGLGAGNQQDTAGQAIAGVFGQAAYPFGSVTGDLSVPLGNRAARAEVSQTAATVMLRTLDLEEAERRVQSEVRLQVQALASAQRKVSLADLNARLAEETLAADEALANAGRTVQTDVLRARTASDQAHADAARARTDWRLAQVELLRLQGALEPRNPALTP